MSSCEEKSENVSSSVVQDDFEKVCTLREGRLLYLQSILPYKSNVKHIEILSAHFHGLILTIYGSKMTEHALKTLWNILPLSLVLSIAISSSEKIYLVHNAHINPITAMNWSKSVELTTEFMDHEIENLDTEEGVLTPNDLENFIAQ